MAITQRFALNAAIQYNEIDLSDYLINDGTTGKKFLTHAPLQRLLRATESAALYFATNDTALNASALYRFYDANNDLIYQYLLDLNGVEPHAAIPINMEMFEQPSDAARLTVTIVSVDELIRNGNFSLGSGDTFTDWNKVFQQTTNEALFSEEMDNGFWKTITSTVTPNVYTAPDGTMTGDRVIPNNTTEDHYIYQDTGGFNIDDYTYSVYAFEDAFQYVFLGFIDSIGAYFVTFFDLSAGTVLTNGNDNAGIELDNNGWYRCWISSNIDMSGASVFFHGGTNIPNSITFEGDGIAGNGFWGSQFETGTEPTFYKPTTSSSNSQDEGSIVSVASGTGRAARINRWTLPVEFNQAAVTSIGQNYLIGFEASAPDGPIEVMLTDGTNTYETFNITSTSTEYFSTTFTATGTALYFEIQTGDYLSMILDNVSVVNTSFSELSETRTYLYDTECVSNEIELNWLNKLGGRDSYVFTGFPIEDRSVDRITPIEYPRLNNYSSPNRIYANRQNISRKGYTITTRCKNRSVAVWLREDIMDSIDVMMRVNGEYLPVEVLDASMVTNDTFSQDYSVRFRIRLAYDINVQTR